jgi:hypothetical protein
MELAAVANYGALPTDVLHDILLRLPTDTTRNVSVFDKTCIINHVPSDIL